MVSSNLGIGSLKNEKEETVYIMFHLSGKISTLNDLEAKCFIVLERKKKDNRLIKKKKNE